MSSNQLAVTIGKFEALHLGHRSLIDSTVKYANDHGLTSAVLSFSPHPAEVLSNKEYKPLFTKEEQFFLLKKFDIGRWIPFPFDRGFSQMLPEEFCRFLITKFDCRAVLVGEGFRFGRNRAGTAEFLRTMGEELGLEVIIVPYLQINGDSQTKISTSKIRECLALGKVRKANELLGMPFMVMGTVQKGRQLGRTISFPTANIHPSSDKFLPPDGVYATRVRVIDRSFKTDGPELGPMPGITNIGTNPTVAEEHRRKAETYIFDFDGDIYGKEILVEFYDFIRPERKFSGLQELEGQIKEDIRKAMLLLGIKAISS